MIYRLLLDLRVPAFLMLTLKCILFCVVLVGVSLSSLLGQDLPTIVDTSNAELASITLSSQELDQDEANVENFSPLLLSSSSDALSRVMAFEWGNYFVRFRNLHMRDVKVLINGIEMNEPLWGSAVWRSWGGLNHIMRYPETATGIEAIAAHHGTVYGISNYSTLASSLDKQVAVDFSISNRSSYQYRFMSTYATGLNKKGWAFVTSASARLGGQPFLASAPEGGFLNAYSLFIALEKQWYQQSINVCVIAAYYKRGAALAPLTREAKELYGIYYNPYWGRLNNQSLNERIRTGLQPIFQLNHQLAINESSHIASTLSMQIGAEGDTRIDRFDQPSSSPLYYKYLPSYAISQGYPVSSALAYDDDEHPETYPVQQRQINWYYLYRVNQALSARDLPAGYILAENKRDNQTYAFTTTYMNNLNSWLTLNATLAYQHNIIDQYSNVYDLLGATYAKNIDVFNDVFKDKNQDASHRLGLGDRIDYNALLFRDYGYMTLLAQISVQKMELALSGRFSYNRLQREGKFWNGLYAEQAMSYGKSKSLEFYLPSVKMMCLYNIAGRSTLKLNLMYGQDAPSLREAFPNSRYDNRYDTTIQARTLLAGDINYSYQSPNLQVKLTLYAILQKNGINVTNYFLQTAAFSALLTEHLTAIDTRSIGTEMSLHYTISSSLQLTLAAHIGEHIYTNNPIVTTYGQRVNETSGEQYYGEAQMKNLRVANGPQQAYHAGLQYEIASWRFSIGCNYLGSSFIQPSAIKRTQIFSVDPITQSSYSNYSEKRAREILQQEELKGGFYANLYIGKLWNIGYKYRLGLQLIISNITNNTDIITSGFEQARYVTFPDADAEAKRDNPLFGNKYWFNQGINIFFNLSFKF